jgi:hypothetical protein
MEQITQATINKMLRTAELSAPKLKDDSDFRTVADVHAAIVQLREDTGIDNLMQFQQYLEQRLQTLQAVAAPALQPMHPQAAAAVPQATDAQTAAAADSPDKAFMARGIAAWTWLRSVDMQQVSHIGNEDASWDRMLGDIRTMTKPEFLTNRDAIETVEALQAQILAFTERGTRRR